LEADVVGAGVVVVVDSSGQGVNVAPGNDGVDEPVAASVLVVGVIEAVASEVVGVV
jgi:hypothetical protein